MSGAGMSCNLRRAQPSEAQHDAVYLGTRLCPWLVANGKSGRDSGDGCAFGAALWIDVRAAAAADPEAGSPAVVMPLRSSLFDSSASSLGSARLAMQTPIDEDAEASASARPELVKCPELLLTGIELEKRTTLRILHKKGRRFESPWEPFFVGIYAHSLFYYAHLGDWPRAVVPLVDADVKAVDRIFRHGDFAAGGDDCGPCWKVTSSTGRVVLFRAPSHEARLEWIEQLRQASGGLGVARKTSMDGKAALALARRLSRSSSTASATSVTTNPMVQSPRARAQSRRRKLNSEDEDSSEALRDALAMVEKQRKEIQELQMRLTMLPGTTNEVEKKDRDRECFENDDGRARGRQLEAPRGKTKRKEVNADGLDLDAMLDDAAVEMCKLSLDSAVAEVLSEDEDTPESEGDEEENIGQVGDQQMRKRGTLQSRVSINDSIETSSHANDGQLAQPACEVGAVVSSAEKVAAPFKQVVTPETDRRQRESTSASSNPEEGSERSNFTSPLSVPSAISYDVAENNSIQQQAAELAEMARTLNKDELTDSSSTRESSEDGSLTSSFKGSHSGTGVFDSSGIAGNDYLQQQAMELAEIARTLQSSLRTDPKSTKKPLQTMSSSPSLLQSQPSFSGFSSSFCLFIWRLASDISTVLSDVTEFGLSQINSNNSNESIFSITQDDLFYDDDDDSEIERLSEFEASDSQFLEASGFLDSIHQVMKDFIVSSQPDQSRHTDQVVISNEIIAEIRQGIDEDASKEKDELEDNRKCATQSESPATGSSNGTSPRIRSLFSHARSARDFFSGDFEIRAPIPQTPKDLPALVVEETMSVVASILQSAGREDKMLLLAPFLRVFGSRNRLSNLIRWAIEIEVASVINVATLFRSDDYASRLVSTYIKAVGAKFIRVALSDPIRQIFKLKIADMELNPHKEESLQDEAQADSNAANLMRTCQNIIDSIMKNTNYIPSSYFHICSHLNSKVISRFDGSKEGVEAEDASTLTRSVIGGFLFLRFVCPAITTPHLYGLTKQLPPPETRRVLVLVTKLLFKTATGVRFGDREPDFKYVCVAVLLLCFMLLANFKIIRIRVLNPFIEMNSPAIQQLFANLAMSPSQDIDECFTSDSRKIYSHVSSSQLVDDLEMIRSISEKNLSEIETKLEECECGSEISENFKNAVLNADPLQKTSLSKKLSANMKFLSGFGKKPRKQSDV
ncbi:unnamed protein product [Phytophthora fragariaefolia]|uniref:Unnamed protein product n=1 Tax=Phytophthora fragariaefolia TaxID=1490495 RepID=A0A9W6X2E4_9STRA|nr:unnamed protein product [Phytophthora fragariaefolia]